MAESETSRSNVIFFLLLLWAASTAEHNVCAKSNKNGGERTSDPLPSTVAVLHEARDMHGLELMQVRGVKKGVKQDIPTSTICNHSLAGIDDELLRATLAHKRDTATSSTAHSLLRTLQQQRIFIAAILHQADGVLPLWTMELVRLLMALRVMGNSSNLFVSVYESGSNDKTERYLNILRGHLKYISVPSSIVTGGVTRMPGRQRIDFLSEMRNRALQPLLTSTKQYDRVLWLSDNLFCADGVLQMFAHALPEVKGGLGADAVCGMDYRTEDGTDQCLFYDRWASHDITGNNLNQEMPIVQSILNDKIVPGPENAQLEAGQPFQVFSCWNAMAVFHADIFQKKHLLFRRSREQLGECAIAETELIFRDMWASGRGKILISPRAASAYNVRDFRKCAADKQPEKFDTAYPVSWKPAPEKVACCPLSKGLDFVQSFENCFLEKWNRFSVPRTVPQENDI